MANPYLVLGGIAVGIVVASMGVLQVPGWVKSAQDASALNDLANAAIGEGIASTKGLGYLYGKDLAAAADELGASFDLSTGVKLCVTASGSGDSYAAVALSPSGAFFARVLGESKAVEATTADGALEAVGGLPAGVPAPMVGADCAPGAELSGGDATGPGGGGGGPAETVPGNAVKAGAVATMDGVDKVAATTHGIYAVDWSGQLVESGDDGLPHVVNATGPLSVMAASGELLAARGIASDAQQNIYLTGGFWDADSATYRNVIVRMAPDHTSTVVADLDPDSRNAIIGSSPDGRVYYFFNGAMWELVGDDSNEIGSFTPSGNGVVNITDDTAGNIYFKDNGWSGSTPTKMTPDGTTSVVAAKVNGSPHELHLGFVAAPNGTIYGSYGNGGPDGGYVGTVASDGTVTKFVSMQEKLPDLNMKFMGPGYDYWNGPVLTDVDMEGNLYANLHYYGSGKSHIVKITPAGDVSIIMANK